MYKIRNRVNGKIYVGLTTQTIEKRFMRHRSYAKHNSQAAIHKAMRRYGSENFTIKVIEECKSEGELKEREIYWIAKLKAFGPKGYNLTTGGDGTFGHHHTEATKAILSEHAKKRRHTDEWKAAMSRRMRGKGHPLWGKKHSEETKRKQGAKNCRKFIVIAPDGKEIVVNGLAEFCRNHNLDNRTMSGIAHGRKKYRHKGYSCRIYSQ